MLRQFLPIHGAIYHTLSEFQAFGFEEQLLPKVLPNNVHYEDKDDPNLSLAAAVTINKSRLLRCGPIDSRLRTQELNALLHYIAQIVPTVATTKKQRSRYSIFQFALPESELDAIRLQRYLLSKYRYESDELIIAHINFPLDLFFYLKTNRPLPSAFSSVSNKLSRLNNIEGWLTYSRWVFEEFNLLIKSIALTDTDKFTLEGTLNDFSLEIRSSLLNTSWQQLEALTLKLGSIEFSYIETSEKPPYQRIIEDEKQAFDLRIELHNYMQIQINLLENIASRIGEIQPFKPELQPLQAIAKVFKELLYVQTDLSGVPKNSFGKQLMLAAFLNCLLGVTTVMTCNTGIERTSISFSISLAIFQLLETESLADILRLVLEWDTSVLLVNLWIVEKGHEAFIDWIKNPLKESGDNYQPALLTTKLRLYVYKNLQTFTTPLLKEVPNKAESIESKKLAVSKEYLNFFPDKFVDYNEKTGEPIAAKPDSMAAIVALF